MIEFNGRIYIKVTGKDVDDDIGAIFEADHDMSSQSFVLRVVEARTDVIRLVKNEGIEKAKERFCRGITDEMTHMVVDVDKLT